MWSFVNPRFIAYVIIGGFAFLVDFFVFCALINNLDTLAANSAGIGAGILVSFSLNRQLNFQVRDKKLYRLAKFAIVALFGLCLSNLGLVVATRFVINLHVAKIFISIIVAIVQYKFNKNWTFRSESN